MQPLRTVLVDDNPGFLDVLAGVLARRETLEVVGLARSAEVALAMARQLKPDVMIVDLVLPDLDGFEVTRRARALAPPPCVVLLSLAEHPAFEQQAQEAGAVGIVNKHDVNTHLMSMIFRCCGPDPVRAGATRAAPAGPAPRPSADGPR